MRELFTRKPDHPGREIQAKNGSFRAGVLVLPDRRPSLPSVKILYSPLDSIFPADKPVFGVDSSAGMNVNLHKSPIVHQPELYP